MVKQGRTSRCPFGAKGAVAIIGDLMVSGIKEELLSNTKHQVKVTEAQRLKICLTMLKFLDKIIQLKPAALDSNENCEVILSDQ